MRRAAVVTIAAATLASGCSRSGSEDHAWEWTNQLEPGSVVHIRNGAGNITVRQGSDGRLATVTGGRRWRRGRESDVQFVVNHTGNEYYVCAMWKHSGDCSASGYHGRSGGFLDVLALFHRTGDATASFVAQLPADVVVDARTTSGTIDVEGASSGLTARATNGIVTATHVSGPIALTTTNGNVNLSVDATGAADSIHLSTTNGVIKAQLPPTIDGTFDLSVTNGSLHSDLPINVENNTRRNRHIAGQIGASARVVRMHATNGNVSVTTKAGPTSH